MRHFSFDFETTTDAADCRVWAWGSYEIYTQEFRYGKDISSFIDYLKKLPGNLIKGSFHNLKFDGEFLVYWLFNNEYKFTTNRKLKPMEFTALIGDMGQWYSLDICLEDGKCVKLIDSAKVYPFSVHDLAVSFHLDEKKGKIDYDEFRPVGHELTEEEVGYLKNDCVIVGKALKFSLDFGDDKMTAGANALAFYKNDLGKKLFEKWFPEPDNAEDEFIRKSYKGGWTYANPEYQGKDIGEGIILDVNSLYPSRMRFCMFPYGKGQYYIGEYRKNKSHPLYVQRIECSFKLKKGYFPTIQLKGNRRFHATEYVETTQGEIVEMTLTNVDLELFLEHYDVEDLCYIDGYMYHGAYGMFDRYIDYWMQVKVDAGHKHDYAMRTLAKLKMNSLYGKFAKKKKGRRKLPYYNEDEDRICYQLSEEEEQEGVYIPLGTFVTSYARDYTIRSAQKCHAMFLYADTDSLHLIGTDIPDYIEVDEFELGKWKHEGTFRRARYLGAKCYIEDIKVSEKDIEEYLEEYPNRECQVDRVNGYKINITCAGLPDKNKDSITYDNFLVGLEIEGKLMPRHVSGGIVLQPTTFAIAPRNGGKAMKKKRNVSRETSNSINGTKVSRETLGETSENVSRETFRVIDLLTSIRSNDIIDYGGQGT